MLILVVVSRLPSAAGRDPGLFSFFLSISCSNAGPRRRVAGNEAGISFRLAKLFTVCYTDLVPLWGGKGLLLCASFGEALFLPMRSRPKDRRDA